MSEKNENKSKKNNKKKSGSKENQTDPEKPSTSRKFDEVIKITDYLPTSGHQNDQTSSSEALESEGETASEKQQRTHRTRSRKSINETDENKEAIIAEMEAEYQSDSDTETTTNAQVQSYDFLEGTKLVTSLEELSLSDSDHEEDNRNDEEKCPKL